MTGSKNNAVDENQSAAAARRAKGDFVRSVSGFRGTLGSGDFPAVPGRYHLYVSLNCS
jgi:glutathionyl-hydroquinone reductase